MTSYFAIAVFALACSSKPKSNSNEKPQIPELHSLVKVSVGEPRRLELKAQPGEKDVMTYRLKTLTEVSQDTQSRSRASSEVGFEVQQEVTKVEENVISAVVTTANKSGEIALDDLALPEIGEKLDMQFLPNGKILKAGQHASNSIYFVPSLSLPESPVQVGDTWLLDVSWMSLSEGIPYRLELVSILKSWVDCLEPSPCADIELSGKVIMPGEIAPLMSFVSEWKGQVLFSQERGRALGTQILSSETLNYDRMGRRVWTCLEGRAKEVAPTIWVSLEPCSNFNSASTNQVTE